jgi:hypothetical protein
MSKEIEKIWRPLETKIFTDQPAVEEEAAARFRRDPAEAAKFLTGYCLKAAEEAVDAYKKLERDLWTKYNYQF